MQYNILINQRAVIDNGLADKLDLFDLSLFDYIYHFFNCNSKKKITFNVDGVEYVEIRLSLINDNMPLLSMKSRTTFISRMNKLVDAGLLERYEKNAAEGRSGYRRGKNFSIFVFKEDGAKTGEQPVQENEQGCSSDCTGGVQVVEHNHNTNIYNTNNITKENNNDKSLLKESAKELSWRNDFLTYLGIVESARKQVLSDNKSRATMEEFYPNIDLEKTINWTVESYWATEEGWKHKKKSNSKSIDMVSTLNKAIKGKYAKIFYKKTSFPKMFAQSTTSNPFEDAERLTKPKELSDGTLTNKGKRFYYTKRGDFTILPMDSPMRPSVDYEWDSLHERWVKDE